MRFFGRWAMFLGLAGAVFAQGYPAAGPGPFKSELERAGYAFGMNIGRGWKRSQVNLDPDKVAQGLKDALSGSAPIMTEGEMTSPWPGTRSSAKRPATPSECISALDGRRGRWI